MVEDIDAKNIWLNYFNNVLYENGIITEEERNRMIILINKNCHISRGADK